MRDRPANDDSTFDEDGWVRPGIRDLTEPPEQTYAERTRQREIEAVLGRSGWEFNRQAMLYTRSGRVRFADLLVWHPRIGVPGIVEVKAEITTPREAADAFKQAIDYTNCKAIGTGQRIAWGAIWPWQPADDVADAMWGCSLVPSLHFKVCMFADLNPGQGGLLASGGPEHIGLFYTKDNRIWSDVHGFAVNAREMLTGRRKVGGQRL